MNERRDEVEIFFLKQRISDLERSQNVLGCGIAAVFLLVIFIMVVMP